MEQQTKNCPYCGEEILAVAKKCKHCGEWLETKEEKETAPAISAEVTPKPEATPASQPATEDPASEVAPVESYYASNNVKLIMGAITAVLVILTIWFFVSPPKIEFDYIFGTISYGMIFMALSVFAVFYFATLFDEKRTSRIYLNSNGDLDIETPREYEPLSVSPVSKVLMRANIFGQKNLSLFKYHDGRVLIRNSKGHEIEGALSDLTYTYKMDKNKVSDEWYIYQYIITDANGNKVQFNQHNSLFTDEEYADMEMLLSFAGTVKESKVSKFTRKADSILSEISDLDFSNLASSAVELVGSTATSKITNAAGLIAKKRIFDHLSDKKKSLFERIKEYGIWIVIAIMALVLIWVNITNAMEAYGGESDSEETEYNYEQSYEQDNSDSNDSSDNESTDLQPITLMPGNWTLSGTLNGYDYTIHICIHENPVSYYDEICNVTSDDGYYGEYNDGNLQITEADVSEETQEILSLGGFFDGKLYTSHGKAFYIGEYWLEGESQKFQFIVQ